MTRTQKTPDVQPEDLVKQIAPAFRLPTGQGWLTLAQHAEMMRVIVQRRADRFNGTPSHFHYCPDCGAGRLYFDRHCEGKHPAGNVEDECRSCEEGHYLKTRRP